MRSVRLTPNQVVAYNLTRARKLHGWTQAQAAEQLEPYLGERWSKASFSVAERSVDHDHRIRQFTADDLVALAAAFRLPVTFFLDPPRDVEMIAAPGAREGVTPPMLEALAAGLPEARAGGAALYAAKAAEYGIPVEEQKGQGLDLEAFLGVALPREKGQES
jgi:hypothetical protein